MVVFRRTLSTSRGRLERIVLVHRHGDRSPITPLTDANMRKWASRLPCATELEQAAYRFPCHFEGEPETSSYCSNSRELKPNEGYRGVVVGDDDLAGRLTYKGVAQLKEVGRTLRRRLVDETQFLSQVDTLSDVNVTSTCIQRTMQSTQSVLSTLSDKDSCERELTIHVPQRWRTMVPDADVTEEQEAIERGFWLGPGIANVEAKLLPVRQKLSALMIENDLADAANLTCGHAHDYDMIASNPASMSWKQIADIVTCTSSWDELPAYLLKEHEALHIMQMHAKWRWFKKFSSGRLLQRLAIGEFVSELLQTAQGGDSKLHIFSAHDSTIVSVLCALGLRLPGEPVDCTSDEEMLFAQMWPEYGASFEIHVSSDMDGEQHVRFFVDGERPLQNLRPFPAHPETGSETFRLSSLIQDHTV